MPEARVPVRLALFVAALAVAVLAGFGVGRLVGWTPGGDGGDDDSGGHGHPAGAAQPWRDADRRVMTAVG